jgi:hypothetical protein
MVLGTATDDCGSLQLSGRNEVAKEIRHRARQDEKRSAPEMSYKVFCAGNGGVVTRNVGRPWVSLRPQGWIKLVSSRASIDCCDRLTPRSY